MTAHKCRLTERFLSPRAARTAPRPFLRGFRVPRKREHGIHGGGRSASRPKADDWYRISDWNLANGVSIRDADGQALS